MNNNTAIEYFLWVATDVLFVESWRQNILQNFAPLGSFFILFVFNFFKLRCGIYSAFDGKQQQTATAALLFHVFTISLTEPMANGERSTKNEQNVIQNLI